MASERDDAVGRARELAEANRRVAAALRYVLNRSKKPEDLAPFIPGAAAALLDLLRSEDFFARKVIENALAVAEADAAAIAADSVQLDGSASLERLRSVADEALAQIVPSRHSGADAEPEPLTEEERSYITALAKLADLAGKEPYVR